MKRLTAMLALLLLLTTLLTAAGAEATLAEWPWDQSAPNQIVHAGDWWYASTGLYGSPTASLAVGVSPQEMTTVYNSQGRIWGVLHATETHAAWVEAEDDTLSWMLHDRVSGETTAICSEAVTDGRPCFSVGLDAEDYYFVRVGAENRCELVRLNLHSGAQTVLPTPEDGVISSLSLEDGEITIACETRQGWYLIRLDSLTGEEVAREALPEEVDLVFYAEYAPRYRSYAIYYLSEALGETVGFHQQHGLNPVLSFAPHTYAYHDYVRLEDTHLLCTVKADRSGAVADNFITLDVHLLAREVAEYEGAIGFTLDDGRLLVLTLDPDNGRLLLEQAW